MEDQNQMRQLPIFKMGGTDFYIDTRCNEFREVDAWWNRISMDELREDPDGTTGLFFNLHTKNVYNGPVDPEDLPEGIVVVIIPPLIELDPVGLARRYGLKDDDLIPDQTQKKGKKL